MHCGIPCNAFFVFFFQVAFAVIYLRLPPENIIMASKTKIERDRIPATPDRPILKTIHIQPGSCIFTIWIMSIMSPSKLSHHAIKMHPATPTAITSRPINVLTLYSTSRFIFYPKKSVRGGGPLRELSYTVTALNRNGRRGSHTPQSVHSNTLRYSRAFFPFFDRALTQAHLAAIHEKRAR